MDNVIYVVSVLSDYECPLGFTSSKDKAEQALEMYVKRGIKRNNLYITKYNVKKNFQEFED